MKKAALTLLFLIVVAAVYAQAPSLPPAPGVGGGGGSIAAPLDGFTWMLLLFGSGYAAREFRKNDKSE